MYVFRNFMLATTLMLSVSALPVENPETEDDPATQADPVIGILQAAQRHDDDDDIGDYIDLEDFQKTVGVTYDEWKQHAHLLADAVGDDAMRALQSSDSSSAELINTVENQLDDDQLTVEENLEVQGRESWGVVGKGLKDAGKAIHKHVIKPAGKAIHKHVIKPVVDTVKKGLNWFKEQANKIGKQILDKIIKSISWDDKQYRSFMFRHAKDFTGSMLDTHDDYDAFNRHGDRATQHLMRKAFGYLPHQDKCDPKRSDWKEYHPTPFSEIAKHTYSPFKVYPFKAQLENDPDGYFIEPCNAISNGFFLTLFDLKEMRSTAACANVDDNALDCVDEDHLLQIVTAGMPLGSWLMHGDGGSPLGGFLDVKGMWVQFYFMYRLMLKNFVHSTRARKLLALPGCNPTNVPDESDGIRWIDSNGERLCHLYWARQFKKLLGNKELLRNKENTTLAEEHLLGLPTMDDSIASTVMVTLRAVFHKKFPFGAQIYTKLSNTIIDSLMKGDSEEQKKGRADAKAFAKALDQDSVLGFENPADGVVAVLDILSDFMDAMFWQESGAFGPGTKGLLANVPPNAGCTWMPHSIWHRKATRVIGGFIKMGKSLHGKLKLPSAMKLWSFPNKGVYANVIKSISPIIDFGTKAFNMHRLAGANFCKETCSDKSASWNPITSTCDDKFNPIQSKTMIVTVGSSATNSKSVSIPARYSCMQRDGAFVVSKANWVGKETFGDTFKLSQNSSQGAPGLNSKSVLTVRRTDSTHGWGMNLQVLCTDASGGIRSGACAGVKGSDGLVNDFVKLPQLVKDIQAKFGSGWPKTGNFNGDKWPMCEVEPKGVPGDFPFEEWGSDWTNHAPQKTPSHNPHRHNPHKHNPHQHNPHAHNPHRHSPHRHNPHRHNPHQHARRRRRWGSWG
jgi:hypothetical protein